MPPNGQLVVFTSGNGVCHISGMPLPAYFGVSFPGIEVCEIVVEEKPEVAEKWKVMTVPTLLYGERRLIGQPKAVDVVRLIGKTGIGPLDGLLIDPFPFSSTVLVLGAAATGRTLLCQEFAYEALRKGLVVAYINGDDFADSVRESISRMGLDIKDYETQGRFAFVDCYSIQAGLESSEKYSADSRDLSDLSLNILKALDELNAHVLILDSLNPFFFGSESEDRLYFLRMLIARIRHAKVSCLIKLTSRALPTETVEAVKDMVDGVVETKMNETAQGIEYFLRILKMKGTRHKTDWQRYRIDPGRGLFYSEKDDLEEKELARLRDEIKKIQNGRA